MTREPTPAVSGKTGGRVDLATPAELAKHLGGSIQTLAVWRMNGTGPRWFKVGRLCRYRWSDVDEWLEAQSNSGSAAA